MANNNCYITVMNRGTATSLSLVACDAIIGKWLSTPRGTIPEFGGDLFVLGQDPIKMDSEGTATYITDSGKRFTILFQCGSSGGACSVSPPTAANVSWNTSGSPLEAAVLVDID